MNTTRVAGAELMGLSAGAAGGPSNGPYFGLNVEFSQKKKWIWTQVFWGSGLFGDILER